MHCIMHTYIRHNVIHPCRLQPLPHPTGREQQGAHQLRGRLTEIKFLLFWLIYEREKHYTTRLHILFPNYLMSKRGLLLQKYNLCIFLPRSFLRGEHQCSWGQVTTIPVHILSSHIQNIFDLKSSTLSSMLFKLNSVHSVININMCYVL